MSCIGFAQVGGGDCNNGDKPETCTGIGKRGQTYTGFVKCGLITPLTNINLFKEGIRQPGPWEATANNGRVQGSNKTTEFTSRILGAPRRSNSPELILWNIIPSNQRVNTG